MSGTRLSAAPCSMRSACPAGCAPCSRRGFTWWEWQTLWYTRHLPSAYVSVRQMRLTTLWFSSSPVDILLRHTGQWVSDIHDFWLYWIKLHFRSPCLLLLYYLISLEDPLCWREVQSFLHLRLPPNCSGHFPGNSALYVFQAEFFILSRWRQNDLIVLHSCDSHVKPSDL